MSRTTSFRAWDAERNAMVDGTDIEEFTEELDEVSYTVDCPRYQTGLSYGAPFVAYINKSGDFTECYVMQSIGLRDKNGKEIYEGDVVNTPNGDWGVIQYDAPYFGVTVSATQVSNYTRGWLESCEVIGNIYENPDLLLR